MKVIEAMARAICKAEGYGVDPDLIVYQDYPAEDGVFLKKLVIDGKSFREMPPTESGVAAWTLYRSRAKAAFEAMKSATNDLEE